MLTDSARTEEIRARVERELQVHLDANPDRANVKPSLESDIRDLLTELSALREEVERWKGALDLIQLNSSCDCDEEFCAKHKAIEALSPSPAQQEGK